MRLGRFTNSLSCLLLLYPLELRIQLCYLSRETLLLILIMYSLILFQQKRFYLLTFVIFLASLTTEIGILLYIPYFICFLHNKQLFNSLLLSLSFSLTSYFVRKIGFYPIMSDNNLINAFKYFVKSISEHREAEGILQTIILPILGCINTFWVSFPAALITALIILESMFKSNSTALAAAIIPQVLSLIGFSFMMTPRIKIGVYFATFFFLLPVISFAALYISKNDEPHDRFD